MFCFFETGFLIFKEMSFLLLKGIFPCKMEIDGQFVLAGLLSYPMPGGVFSCSKRMASGCICRALTGVEELGEQQALQMKGGESVSFPHDCPYLLPNPAWYYYNSFFET